MLFNRFCSCLFSSVTVITNWLYQEEEEQMLLQLHMKKVSISPFPFLPSLRSFQQVLLSLVLSLRALPVSLEVSKHSYIENWLNLPLPNCSRIVCFVFWVVVKVVFLSLANMRHKLCCLCLASPGYLDIGIYLMIGSCFSLPNRARQAGRQANRTVICVCTVHFSCLVVMAWNLPAGLASPRLMGKIMILQSSPSQEEVGVASEDWLS